MEKGSLYARSLNPFAITDDGRDVSILVSTLISATLHFG